MEKKKMQNQLLLLEDVVNLGKKGDLATAKPGFVRNFLLPQKKAIIADKRTIRMQEALKKERAAQALKDAKESKELAKVLKEVQVSIEVKSDTSGHLYGSVAHLDILKVLEKEKEIKLERRNVLLTKPIKKAGIYEIQLNLKEDVPATFKLEVIGDQYVEKKEEPKAEAASEEGEELPTPEESQAEAQSEIDERSKEEK